MPALAALNTPWMSWGSYLAATAACSHSTSLGPKDTVLAMIISNNLHQTSCHHKSQWTLHDPVAISTQARGEACTLVQLPLAYPLSGCINRLSLSSQFESASTASERPSTATSGRAYSCLSTIPIQVQKKNPSQLIGNSSTLCSVPLGGDWAPLCP
jgi:hypothetical protein